MLTLPTENLDCLAGLTFQLFVFPLKKNPMASNYTEHSEHSLET